MEWRIFISIVGSNDEGKLTGREDGAILTALKNYKKNYFNAVYLLCTVNRDEKNKFIRIAKYLSSEIQKRGYCGTVEIDKLSLNNVIDHNEIYTELLSTCREIKGRTSGKAKYIASISSGTPAMSVCWIMMAESGDFEIELIQVRHPKYKQKIINKVKLGTALPRIKRLEEEVSRLKPEIEMDVKKAHLFVNKNLIDLSMTEFVYYRNFLERKLKNEEALRVSEIFMPSDFFEKVMQYFYESFPSEDLYYKNKKEIQTANFRATIAKIKSKFKRSVANSLVEYIEVSSLGKRRNLTYEIRLNKEKIRIIK